MKICHRSTLRTLFAMYKTQRNISNRWKADLEFVHFLFYQQKCVNHFVFNIVIAYSISLYLWIQSIYLWISHVSPSSKRKKNRRHRITWKRLWKSLHLKRQLTNRCHDVKVIMWTSKTSSHNRYVKEKCQMAFSSGFPFSQIDIDSNVFTDAIETSERHQLTFFLHYCSTFFFFFSIFPFFYFPLELSCTFHDDIWTWPRRANREHNTSHHKRFKYLVVGSNSSISCINRTII